MIGQIGTADAVPVLLDVARRSRPNSFAFMQTSDALDMLGATAQANQFAAELAARPDASKAMLMAVFTRSYQDAGGCDRRSDTMDGGLPLILACVTLRCTCSRAPVVIRR